LKEALIGWSRLVLDVRTPCIIHYNYNPYVGVTGDPGLIGQPGKPELMTVCWMKTTNLKLMSWTLEAEEEQGYRTEWSTDLLENTLIAIDH
jgi:hypothetical protein